MVHEDEVDGYTVRRWRPRVEGLHARIERWSRIGDAADVHWRSISRDNVLTLYGLTPQSRIADPADPARIFSWLVCETRDDRGNAVLYRYKAEDGEGVALERAHQRNRGGATDARRSAMRYPKRVLWGNRDPLLAADGPIRRVPTVAREVYDVVGAGDTVTAYLATVLAAGGSVEEAAVIANYAAGVEVAKLGAATVTPDEILDAYDAYAAAQGSSG